MLRTDLATMFWKEWRALFRQRESRMRVFLSTFFPLLFFGVVLPLESGPRWFAGHSSLLISCIVPILFALLVIPEAFAGEREKHTLATLLATRLSDGAILYGKTLFALALGWGGTWFVLALGVVSANFSDRVESFTFYSWRVLAVNLSASLALGVFAVWLGVWVSLRARTVQGAQQTLSALLLVPGMLLGPVVLLVSQYFPRFRPASLIARAGPTTVFLVVLGCLVLADALLVRLAARRFRRDRLVEG